MKYIAFLALTASLYAGPLTEPDRINDSQEVVSPNIGRVVVPTGDFSIFLVCLNDNPSNAQNNDHDYNDVCATAEFQGGGSNVLKLSFDSALSAWFDSIGVKDQTGMVNSSSLEAFFTYVPNVETIFSGYVNGRSAPVYYSGSGGASSNPAGDNFYTECVLCNGPGRDVGDSATPEPAAFVLVGMGLAGLAVRRFRTSN